ncbi:MAG: 3-hydroxyacyl-ACP dehydratase FabZ [Coriobacteriales bacterium]|jgi:3-hydroxyacyl-[acyl-carrier-protein] dehydratase|nr:3-hydroxyacyl-ACP dehydratase FabZ [Coriobacteriales bacterium]
MPQLDIEQIKQILPHRYPFLLIDRVIDFESGVWARAVKCVTANEPFFQGHFPEQAVMPGVLILEALAQTGAIALLSEPGNEGRIALFGGVKNARFKQVVVPGDVLELECRLTKRWGPVGQGEAVAKVAGKVACKAEISFMLPEGTAAGVSDDVAIGAAGKAGGVDMAGGATGEAGDATGKAGDATGEGAEKEERAGN